MGRLGIPELLIILAIIILIFGASRLPEIGRGIGGRNHTTVLHAVNRVGASLRSDDSVRIAVDNLRRRLGHPSS